MRLLLLKDVSDENNLNTKVFLSVIDFQLFHGAYSNFARINYKGFRGYF